MTHVCEAGLQGEATPEGAKVGAGYLKITNTGKETDRLIGGSLPAAMAIEVHQMTMSDGVKKMRKMDHGIEIKPGQTAEVQPGGYHLMFIGPPPDLRGSTNFAQRSRARSRARERGTRD